MSYVSIDSSVKVAAVKRYWQTNNVQQTAREFQISRSTLYEWVRLAEANLEQAFLESKPGKRGVSAEEESEKLREQLDQVLDAYHNISQADAPELPETLTWCHRCKEASLVRNGRVRTKRHGLRQRLLCRTCGDHVYVEVKKTL